MTEQWIGIGRLALEDGSLVLPEVPAVPGLYRLLFDSGDVYIGEAGDLRRRLGDYLVYYPSVGIESEFRLNKRLREEHGAEVEILIGAGFAARPVRCKREYEEIKAAKERSKQTGCRLLNGGTIKDRIAFHRAEIERLEAKLNRTSTCQDLDEMMHEELLANVSANSLSDELIRRQAVELGFSDDQINSLIGKTDGR